MKIQIEIDKDIKENEVTIKCNDLTDEIKKIQKVLTNLCAKEIDISYYKDDTEYYINLDQILFFQTEDSGVTAHTKNDIYSVKYKLYELEELLPENFIRVSKSGILNTDKIFSITRNITSSSIVQFQDSHKKIYVSRHYYKELKFYLSEKRR